MTIAEYYDLTSHFDEGSCNEEEEYRSVSKQEEEAKYLDPEHEYDTPTTVHTLSEVRSRNSSLGGFVNTSNTNNVNSGQGSLTSQNFFLSVT